MSEATRTWRGPLRQRLQAGLGWGWALAWLLLCAAGGLWLVARTVQAQREAFETDARIVHRLLSQRAVEHDAVLATLALLQPGAVAGEGAPEQRLPSVYPQLLAVLRRDAGQTWAEPALAEGEARSRQSGRAELAAVDWVAGHYTLVRAAQPASFALRVDLRRLVPRVEWPLQDDGPVRLRLQLSGGEWTLVPGSVAPEPTWRFDFRKHLAPASQPFDVVAERRLGAAELPWAGLLAWALAVAAALWAGQSAWRQRRERLRAQELLRLGQVGKLNALGELAAGLAHELNQPLTAVLANANAARRLLDEDPPELAPARQAMTQAAQQARRAAEVLGRLRRSVERPDTGASLSSVALEGLLRRTLDLLSPDLQAQGVQLSVQAQPGVRVLADAVALEQVLHNLLGNALQALSQVPAAERQLQLRLQVRPGPAGPRGELQVQDSGPGFAPEVLPRVFEPFFSTRPGGLGLGLSLCETLVSGMGGELRAAQAHPRGALFTLSLPLPPTHSGAAEAGAPPAASAP